MNTSGKDRPRHEPTDASPGTVGLIAAALFLLVVAGIIGGAATMRLSRGNAPVLPGSTSFTGGSRDRPDIVRSWQDHEQEAAAHLNGYGWVDRKAGTVRIPIERAMDLVAQEAKP